MSKEEGPECRVERSLKAVKAEAEAPPFEDLEDNVLRDHHAALSDAAVVLARHHSHDADTRLAKLLKLQIKQLLERRRAAKTPHLVTSTTTKPGMNNEPVELDSRVA